MLSGLSAHDGASRDKLAQVTGWAAWESTFRAGKGPLAEAWWVPRSPGVRSEESTALWTGQKRSGPDCLSRVPVISLLEPGQEKDNCNGFNDKCHYKIKFNSNQDYKQIERRIWISFLLWKKKTCCGFITFPLISTVINCKLLKFLHFLENILPTQTHMWDEVTSQNCLDLVCACGCV